MDKAKVQALAANVNGLLGLYDKKEQTTAELFKVCLEFLDEERWPRVTDHDIQRAGGVFKAEKEMRIKRKERKQELIAAIKGYIKMIEKREDRVTSHTNNKENDDEDQNK
jgi:hypothetical protein